MKRSVKASIRVIDFNTRKIIAARSPRSPSPALQVSAPVAAVPRWIELLQALEVSDPPRFRTMRDFMQVVYASVMDRDPDFRDVYEGRTSVAAHLARYERGELRSVELAPNFSFMTRNLLASAAQRMTQPPGSKPGEPIGPAS